MQASSDSQPIGRVISAAFLVGGTCIGGGMLALPVATGVIGFVPSIVVMLVCWAMMTATGLLLLEASLWMPKGSHIITMSSTLLGPWGRRAAWLFYLFICYASVVAYTAGGGLQIIHTLNESLGIALTKGQGCLLFLVAFGFLVYFGSRIVGRINAILFTAMIAAYFLLVFKGVGEVKAELLEHRRWGGALLAVPLLLTAFSHQTMVPSLTQYLRGNVRALRWAIICGTTIALFVYMVWEGLILGIVPAEGLADALAQGRPATQFLRGATSSKWVIGVGEFFAFFAIVTSFLGMTLGLYDFLSDGLKIPRKGWGKLALGALIVLPTYFFATYFERAFLIALDTSGGFGDSVLSGFLPVLMVWIGRHKLGLPRYVGLWGSRVLLVVLLAFYLGALLLELSVQLGFVTPAYELFGTLD